MADPSPLEFAIDLATVRDRLILLGHFRDVGDLQAATNAIVEERIGPREAFVSVASETATPNKTIGGHAQRVSVTLSVLFAEQAARALDNADDEIEQVRKAIIRQLTGWTPAGAQRPLDYDRYLVRGMVGGIILSEVLLRTEYRLTL